MTDTNGSAAVPVVADAFEKARFRMVGEIGPLFTALAKASIAFGPIERSKTVEVRPRDQSKQAYKFSYAPLENLIEATREALAANELVVAQPYHSAPGGWLLRTILAHSSGAYMESIDFIESTGSMSNQDLGGTLTFRRRYGYGAILSLSADDDDDANAADGNAAVTVPKGAKSTGSQPAAKSGAAKPAASRRTSKPAETDIPLPPNWPSTDNVGIIKWIDALEPSTPDWRKAWGHLKNNTELYNCLEDWELVFAAFQNRYRTLLLEKKIEHRQRDGAFENEVKAEGEKLAADKASKFTDPPAQGSETHEPADQAN